MTYIQKLTKIGNSVGVILPKALLDSLNLKLGNELYIETVQDKIILEKEAATSISPEFLRIADTIGTKYKQTFKQLASR